MKTAVVRTRSRMSPQMRQEVITLIEEKVGREGVRREDFGELKEIVRQIGVSQHELAEAQKRTETRVEELAEAQKRTETRVEELAEAQKRTETRVEELADAQKDLAEAQKETARQVAQLCKHVGGLSNSVGYALENETYRALPSILRERHGIELRERFLRKYIHYLDGRYDEVNLIGEGTSRTGAAVTIIGEVKTKLAADDIDDFIEKVERVRKEIKGDLLLVAVTHLAHPDVVEHAKRKNISVIHTYEF